MVAALSKDNCFSGLVYSVLNGHSRVLMSLGGRNVVYTERLTGILASHN